MEQSYEFTGVEKVNDWGVTVKQIRATRDIPRHGVHKGDLGGWVESAELTNGDARVFGDAGVYGNAQVFGAAQVYGAARVCGDAWVYESWHFLVVGPIGSEGVTATLARTKNGKHILNVGCWTGTLGTLMGEVKRRRANWTAGEVERDLWTAQYQALKAVGKATAARWAEAKENA